MIEAADGQQPFRKVNRRRLNSMKPQCAATGRSCEVAALCVLAEPKQPPQPERVLSPRCSAAAHLHEIESPHVEQSDRKAAVPCAIRIESQQKK